MKSKGIISATLEGRWEKQLAKGHWAPLVPVIMLSLQLHCEYPDTHFIYVCNTYMVQTLYKITYIFFLLCIWNISDRRVFVSQWTMSHENTLLHGYEGVELPWIIRKIALSRRRRAGFQSRLWHSLTAWFWLSQQSLFLTKWG